MAVFLTNSSPPVKNEKKSAESSRGKNSELEKNSELATRDRGEIGRSTVGFEAFTAVR